MISRNRKKLAISGKKQMFSSKENSTLFQKRERWQSCCTRCVSDQIISKNELFLHNLCFFHETRKLQVWAKLSKLSEDDTFQENNALTSQNLNLTKRENEKLDEGCPV